MNQIEYNLFVFYYVLASLAISANALVIFYMIYYRYLRNIENNRGKSLIQRVRDALCVRSAHDSTVTGNCRNTFIRNPFYFAILMLHVSNIGEEITLIPWIYKGNTDLCVFVEAVKYYFSLMNCFSWFFLIQVYRILLFSDCVKVNNDKASFGDTFRYFRYHPDFRFFVYFIFFIFPLVCFVPFITGTYRSPSIPWCTMSINSDFYVGFFLEYFWTWLALFACVITNAYIFLKIVLIMKDSNLLNRYLCHAGVYSFVALIAWIPRSVFYILDASTYSENFIQYVPTYFTGIFFCILFIHNREAIFYYEDKDFSEGDLELKASDLFHIVDDLEPFNALVRNTISFIGRSSMRISLMNDMHDPEKGGKLDVLPNSSSPDIDVRKSYTSNSINGAIEISRASETNKNFLDRMHITNAEEDEGKFTLSATPAESSRPPRSQIQNPLHSIDLE